MMGNARTRGARHPPGRETPRGLFVGIERGPKHGYGEMSQMAGVFIELDPADDAVVLQIF